MCSRWRGTRRNLADRGQAMFLVAGIDALRAVAGEEIAIEFQPRHALEDRNTYFFRAAGINRRLVDHDVALLEYAANRLARANQRRQLRPLVFVDRCGHRDYHDATGLSLIHI